MFKIERVNQTVFFELFSELLSRFSGLKGSIRSIRRRSSTRTSTGRLQQIARQSLHRPLRYLIR